MTNIQKILIVGGTAAVFQIAQLLAGVGPDDLLEPRKLLVSAIISVANAVGIALVALRTTGGLSVSRPAE
jgi:hypothetical protein